MAQKKKAPYPGLCSTVEIVFLSSYPAFFLPLAHVCPACVNVCLCNFYLFFFLFVCLFQLFFFFNSVADFISVTFTRLLALRQNSPYF